MYRNDVEKLDIDKLKTVPTGNRKLRDVVENVVVKNADIMNWLKKLMLFMSLILANQLKKLTATQNIQEIEIKYLP